jgi:hypothetical protein
VRSAAPQLDGGTEQRERGRSAVQPPSGTELITTVVQAAGELARIGLTLGTQIVKRAASRLPLP